MNKDERAQLLREIDNLVDDFKMLRVAAVSGRIRIDRQRNVSRMPTLKDEGFFLRLRDERHPTAALNSYGICEVETLTQPPADTKEAPSLLFPKTGQPLLIIKPELITLKSAHVSLHRIFISGTNCDAVKAAFDRASEWTKRRFKLISKAIFPERLVSFGAYCWLDVVLEIAQQSDDATMIKPIWLMEYKRIGDVICSGVITKGDEPEEKYCEVELKPFLRDSELALDWLRRWVESQPESAKLLPATDETGDQSPTCENDLINSMDKRFRLAYLAAKQAEHECARELTDMESFQWLKEHGFEGYKLPIQDTFADYLTKARKIMGEQRKTPRSGRTSRSVVKQSEQ
jgi:hypothetical protein